MKAFESDFLEKTDVKNIIEYIKTNGLENISSYDVNNITDDNTKEFFDGMLEFVTDYTKKENAENYSRSTTAHFKKRYDTFLMYYDVLLKNDLVNDELKKLKEYYDRIMLNKISKLISEIQSLPEDKLFEKQAKLDALERIFDTLKLSTEVVTLSEKHQPLFTTSKAEFEKLKTGAIKQKETDEIILESESVTLETIEDSKKEESENIEPVIETSLEEKETIAETTPEKKSKLDVRLESLKLELVPEEELQRLKQETEVLFESINKASKDGSSPQVINELYSKYKEAKADLEFAIENNEKVNKKIARLEGAKKLASIPRKEFHKLKTTAKVKAAAAKKQIHDKVDPIYEQASAKVSDIKGKIEDKAVTAVEHAIGNAINAKQFVSNKATDAKDFVSNKASDAKDFVTNKVETVTNFVSEKTDELADKVVTGYNNTEMELQRKVNEYGAEVKSQEQISSEAISEALAHMGNDVSIAEVDAVITKINKEAAKDSMKAQIKVTLFGALQKLHSIPKALADSIKQKSITMNEEQLSAGRTI